MKRLMITIGIAAMALAGCSQSKDAANPAIDPANFDESTAPGEDS